MTAAHSVALITPSYKADFERCRLLCDSIDRFVEDRPDHFILVDNDDYGLFCELAGSKRHIINELDILPGWLRSLRPGFSSTARKLWWSTRTWPMRGWHVQQLRRIAIAQFLTHEGLLYCDSDMLFVRPFVTSSLWHGENLRLYRKDHGINQELPDSGKLHRNWTDHAHGLNGLAAPRFPSHDYINNLVSWRRDHVVAMLGHIEATTGKNWLAAIASRRSFSECQIYGAFADKVLNGQGHWLGHGALCQTYWSGDALTRETIGNFVNEMSDGQVAIGIQSFTGTDPVVLRDLLAA